MISEYDCTINIVLPNKILKYYHDFEVQTILWVTITIGNDAKNNLVIIFSMIESIVLTRTSVIFQESKIYFYA